MGTTATPTKPKVLYGANVSTATFKGHAVETQADGTAVVRGVEIFKSGTFRDSWGEQHTWEPHQLAQMVDNFELLRSRDIFPDVPVRRDHSFSVDKVFGYFESLYVREEGATTKLVADFRVTEPDQIGKLERGTYRSVSAEIGMYETNDGAAYWPVMFGVAYVDIPAVEGLHSKSLPLAYFSRTETENTMTATNTEGAATEAKPADAGASRPAAPAPHTFTIAGRSTTDYGAVQEYVNSLEKVVKDNDEKARKDFVSALAAERKIVAAQEKPLAEFALALSTEQYEAWTKTFEGATALPLLAEHGNANGNPDAGANEDTQATEIADLEAVLAMHKRAGLSEDQIKNTKTFKRLTELKG